MLVDCEELPGKLRDICRGAATDANGVAFSAFERRSIIARRLKVDEENVDLPTSVLPEPRYEKKGQPILVDPVIGIGTAMKQIIRERTGKDVSCGDCRREIEAMNRQTVEEVQARKQELARQIVHRGKVVAARWWERMAATLIPEELVPEVVEWIDEACRLHEQGLIANQIVESPIVHQYATKRFLDWLGTDSDIETSSANRVQDGRTVVRVRQRDVADLQWHVEEWERPGARQMSWAYGVTTVPHRKSEFEKTIASLSHAGFDRPRVFVDAPPDAYYEQFGLPVSFRGDNIRTASHWILSLQELFFRDPEADRYAIIQDDVRCSAGLREYLDTFPFPDDGYWNLFTFFKNEKLIARMEQTGWTKSNQLGQGGLFLVFDNAAVVDLLSDPSLLRRAWTERRHKWIDGAVVKAMKNSGRKELIHNPSLVQHTGHESSMGNRPEAPARTFKGEQFDLMSLLPGRAPMVEQDVLVVIPGYNLPDKTVRCVKAVNDSTLTKTEIVYVDNGSTPEAVDAVSAALVSHQHRIVRNEANEGFTAAVQKGLDLRAAGQHVLVLNNDCYVSPTAIEELLQTLTSQPDVAAVCPVTDDDGACSIKHQKNRIAKQRRSHRYVNMLPWFCCLLRADALDAVPQLPTDEAMKSGLGVDDWWCRQLVDLGWRLAINGNAFARHDHKSTFQATGQNRREQQIKAEAWLRSH